LTNTLTSFEEEELCKSLATLSDIINSLMSVNFQNQFHHAYKYFFYNRYDLAIELSG